MKNKILSVLLAVLIVLSVVPFTAMNAQADFVYRSKTILPEQIDNYFESITMAQALMLKETLLMHRQLKKAQSAMSTSQIFL